METLQELELLTSEVLLPLLSHTVVQDLIKNLKYVIDCEANLVCLPLTSVYFLTLSMLLLCYTRSSSVVCSVQSSHQGPESIPSLPNLACLGWRDRLGLVVPSSPFPLLTGLGLLLETITGIHKGLSCKVSF